MTNVTEGWQTLIIETLFNFYGAYFIADQIFIILDFGTI